MPARQMSIRYPHMSHVSARVYEPFGSFVRWRRKYRGMHWSDVDTGRGTIQRCTNSAMKAIKRMLLSPGYQEAINGPDVLPVPVLIPNSVRSEYTAVVFLGSRLKSVQ